MTPVTHLNFDRSNRPIRCGAFIGGIIPTLQERTCVTRRARLEIPTTDMNMVSVTVNDDLVVVVVVVVVIVVVVVAAR